MRFSRFRFPLIAAASTLIAVLFAGCQRQGDNRVVLYCSVDEVYSRPLIAILERETGLDIEPLFDVESAKAAGLANKLRAEHNRPRADVFWASTTLQSQLLAHEGLLAPYVSPSARDVPARLKDPQGHWTAMGVRARVLISSRAEGEKSLAVVPANLRGKFAISNPQFGTCSDWAAAYGARWGTSRAARFFSDLKGAGARILPGNADVASAVADGNLRLGVTDSDDYLAQKREKKTVFLVRTTQDNVLVPGSASLLAGAPHEANAKKLLDALLSAQSEARLVKAMPGVFSVRHLDDPKNWQSGGEDFSFLRTAPRDELSGWRMAWEKLRRPLADSLSP